MGEGRQWGCCGGGAAVGVRWGRGGSGGAVGEGRQWGCCGGGAAVGVLWGRGGSGGAVVVKQALKDLDSSLVQGLVQVLWVLVRGTFVVHYDGCVGSM